MPKQKYSEGYKPEAYCMRRFVAALILQTCNDIRRGDMRAAVWLATAGARLASLARIDLDELLELEVA